MVEKAWFRERVLPLKLDTAYYPKTYNVEEVLNQALEYFRENHYNKSILSHINVPAGGKLHVIGDIHGNKQALFQYLDYIGPLSHTNQLLFLGDIVDRGRYEWHCMLVVLLYQIRYPAFCTILRGNHEEVETSSEYGMFNEYNALKSTKPARKSMSNIFAHLKLCCIVNEKFFCVHGGPPVAKETTIKQLSEDFRLPLSICSCLTQVA